MHKHFTFVCLNKYPRWIIYEVIKLKIQNIVTISTFTYYILFVYKRITLDFTFSKVSDTDSLIKSFKSQLFEQKERNVYF